MKYPKPKQWELLSLVPILAGLYWLLADAGAGWLIWAVFPGGLLLAAGVALLLIPGDHRILGLMAGGALIGIVLTPVAWMTADLEAAFYALLGSVASFLVAGRVGLAREPLYEGAQAPELSVSMDAKAALDEALLGYFVCTARVPSEALAERVCMEAMRLEAAMRERGWLADPSAMHPQPVAPESISVQRARWQGHNYEILRFDSAYPMPSDLPRAQDWSPHGTNADCHVRVWRHAGAPRPWLLCLHGYRMGMNWLDFSLFTPAWLHHRLGLNLVMPVLPLHGPRSIGLRSGDHFLDGDLLNLLYAEAQALWDLRRTLAWLRASEASPRIGVLGFSLGGYNAALLATCERELDFVLAGIPVTDFAAALWRLLPPAHLRYFAAHGLDEAHYRRVLSVVSPLAHAPLPPRQRLHICAATGDRIVPPYQPLRLADHWQVPVQWYQGSHLSVRRERVIHDALRQAIAGAGWALQ